MISDKKETQGLPALGSILSLPQKAMYEPYSRPLTSANNNTGNKWVRGIIESSSMVIWAIAVAANLPDTSGGVKFEANRTKRVVAYRETVERSVRTLPATWGVGTGVERAALLSNGVGHPPL